MAIFTEVPRAALETRIKTRSPTLDIIVDARQVDDQTIPGIGSVLHRWHKFLLKQIRRGVIDRAARRDHERTTPGISLPFHRSTSPFPVAPKRRFTISVVWLGDQDSNLGSRSQSPMFYR